MDFIEELKWRGMIHDMMPGTEEQLKKEMTTAYVGIDPTADSLHIGHLVGVMMLKHFQRCGHRPLALVGGATGMIGDPSGKSQERNLLDEKTLRHNQEAIKAQLSRFLDFDSDAPNAAELVNNYDWMKEFSFLDFIRDVGKHITVNYIMAKDSVKKSLSSESSVGMSFTEFTYQLVQGYDFLYLNQTKNCKLQMGGSDQWGNITTGTELIRRKSGGEAFALTCPLITKADGGKFGKTESGNVWLDRNYTSPYKFYQFWLNVSDADAEKYIKIFTFLTKEEVEALIAEHQQIRSLSLVEPGMIIIDVLVAALHNHKQVLCHAQRTLMQAVQDLCLGSMSRSHGLQHGHDFVFLNGAKGAANIAALAAHAAQRAQIFLQQGIDRATVQAYHITQALGREHTDFFHGAAVSHPCGYCGRPVHFLPIQPRQSAASGQSPKHHRTS